MSRSPGPLPLIRSDRQLASRFAPGPLDLAIPVPKHAVVQKILEQYREQGIQWHALRTRQSGSRRFVSLPILVPGDWTVQRGHDLLELIERNIRAALPSTKIFTTWSRSKIRAPSGTSAWIIQSSLPPEMRGIRR